MTIFVAETNRYEDSTSYFILFYFFDFWVFILSWMKKKGSPPVHSYLPEWLDLGVSIIGGCCKTTADDIKCFKGYVDDHNVKHMSTNNL